ncbi:hypothetical protein QEG98_42140 (plasmid) [Myxococcus sp. MxC21-1]|uniref:hypothetical protein n=1 Tax=Myxococcus sp. MxC21-1 TaxID=3041439 RepID=UPI00292FDEE1|nr:hypothetical protein [Myxococcus sp. MxC21-1]WNZ66222.1 hypothetical protein QEG98_42140 [Myxococcus sp. MxC21-1]
MPLLVQLVSNSFVQVNQVTESLQMARSVYQETQRLTSYAAEAAAEFDEFQRLGARAFTGDVGAALDSAFPDLGYIRRQAASDGAGMFRNERNLSRTVRFCLSSGNCAEVQEVQSLRDVTRSISAAFGTSPAGDVETRVMDEQAALAIVSAESQMARNEVLRLQAAELMKRCTEAKDLSACQAAASVAEIAALEQSAAIADQLAQANTLQATELAHQAAERRRQETAAQQREEFLRHAVESFTPMPPAIRLDEGFDMQKEAR